MDWFHRLQMASCQSLHIWVSREIQSKFQSLSMTHKIVRLVCNPKAQISWKARGFASDSILEGCLVVVIIFHREDNFTNLGEVGSNKERNNGQNEPDRCINGVIHFLVYSA